jgi:hypothetical protein
MNLVEELGRVADHAAGLAGDAVLTGVLPAEAARGLRAYVCAFEGTDGRRSWVVVDSDAAPVRDRRDARDAVSIAALCEIAAESAFPGDLDELRSQLVALRITEAPDGIEDAEEAVAALARVLGAAPTLATPERLDAIGQAAHRLERALDPAAPSPFSSAMRSAQAVVDELWREVETGYRVPFEQ